MKLNKTFKKNPRYPHKRSEGLTRRGAARQDRLMTGPGTDIPPVVIVEGRPGYRIIVDRVSPLAYHYEPEPVGTDRAGKPIDRTTE